MPIKWSRLCKSMTNSQRKETPNNKFSFGAACSRRLFGCQRRPKKKKKNYSNRQLCVECRAHPAAGIPLVGGAPHNTRSQRGQICLSWYAKHHRRHFIVIIIIAVPTITWSFIHSLHSTRNSQLIRLSKKSQINSILFFFISSPPGGTCVTHQMQIGSATGNKNVKSTLWLPKKAHRHGRSLQISDLIAQQQPPIPPPPSPKNDKSFPDPFPSTKYSHFSFIEKLWKFPF